MEGKHPEDTDGETMVLIIKLELEYENEHSFVEPVSSLERLDNDENFRNETKRYKHKGNSVTLDCELNPCYSEHMNVDGAHESSLQRESRSTNELLTKANGSKRNETVDRNELPLVSTSRFIKSEKFSPIVHQKIDMNGNKNISCSNCLKIFSNENCLLLHLDKEHPDIKCGPKVMFVDEVNQDGRIFDFIHKSRIKKEKVEQKLRTIQNQRKDYSSGNKTIKMEYSDLDGHPKVMFVDEVDQDDRIFDFIHKSRIKKENLQQKQRTIQDYKKAHYKGNKTIKMECSDSDGHPKVMFVDEVNQGNKIFDFIHSDSDGHKVFLVESSLKKEVDDEHPYQCQFCEKSFVQKGSLNSHFRTNHQDGNIDSQVMPKVNLKRKKAALVSLLDKKPYICDGCQRPFTFKTNLKRHLKNSCPAVTK